MTVYTDLNDPVVPSVKGIPVKYKGDDIVSGYVGWSTLYSGMFLTK